jgi:two-component system, chemotaxis family, CheB/CheR fusion protein
VAASIGMNLDWVILSWNRGAHRMYGYTSDEIKGNFIDALFAPERRHEVDILREKLQAVKQVTFDTMHVRKSGVKIEVRLIASRILDTTGTLIGISLLAREFPVSQRPLTPQSQPITKPFAL